MPLAKEETKDRSGRKRPGVSDGGGGCGALKRPRSTPATAGGSGGGSICSGRVVDVVDLAEDGDGGRVGGTSGCDGSIFRGRLVDVVDLTAADAEPATEGPPSPRQETCRTEDGALDTPGLLRLLLMLLPHAGARHPARADVRTCGLCVCRGRDPSGPGGGGLLLLPRHYRQPDRWSCGYRNLQMILSSLLPRLPEGHPCLTTVDTGEGRKRWREDRAPPPLPVLQSLVEEAWAAGFDPSGADHFRRRLRGGKDRIGAVEVGSLLWQLRIDAAVVQFVRTRESRAMLGGFIWEYFAASPSSRAPEAEAEGDKGRWIDRCAWFDRGAVLTSSAEEEEEGKEVVVVVAQSVGSVHGSIRAMLRAVERNGSANVPASADGSAGACCRCALPGAPLVPLYLQWEGHSVTVVGIERLQGFQDPSYNLLVFDPLTSGEERRERMLRLLHSGPEAMREDLRRGRDPIAPFRLSARDLKSRDCQIMVCGARPLGPMERRERMGDGGLARFTVTAGLL